MKNVKHHQPAEKCKLNHHRLHLTQERMTISRNQIRTSAGEAAGERDPSTLLIGV